MINDHTLARFEPLGDHLVKPVYADYSFANLPATLHFLLTGEHTGALIPADCFGGAYPSPQKVVLIFVDSFGWQFWQRHGASSRIMRHVMEAGTLTPISALFPSTTAASVSTLNLGCLPAKHAVYEWQMYVPAFGETIQSLAFMTLGPQAVPCGGVGFDVADLVIERETVHQRLAAHGVRSIQLAHAAYAHSPYNRIASAGADVITHRTLPEACVQLRDVLAGTTGKALIQLYWAGLDTAAHIHGPGSAVHEAEIASFWTTLDHLLAGVESPDTLFLFTADHGHVSAFAAPTIYVNERWPQIEGWLSISHTGETIWPNGSPRDMFLHVVAERRSEMFAILAAGLADVATVLTVDQALAAGLFGPEPVCAELRARLGDILILPHPGYFVWWRNAIIKNPFLGHHGGLSRDELITVLGVVGSLPT
jgi:hypothetical protein